MVTVFANRHAGSDDSGSDELLSLKEIILLLYWKEFKKVIYVKFQFFIEKNP